MESGIRHAVPPGLYHDLIGCAAKAAQMPAEPEPVALLPEQKQSSIVTNDAKNETIPPPQQSEHEDTPVRIVESNPADTPANADTEVPQAAQPIKHVILSASGMQ